MCILAQAFIPACDVINNAMGEYFTTGACPDECQQLFPACK